MKRYADLASLRRWKLSSLALICGLVAFSQDIAIGTWRTHFSYNDARHLAATSEKIFCATNTGLFSRDLSEGSVRKLSKIDGLSDVGVSALAYNVSLNVLVIGYQSGFVDFIFEDEIRSIPDIAISNLDGDKTINDIAFGTTNTFLATDLGVIVINTSNAEIIENYVQIGTAGEAVEVLEIVTNDNSLFVRTNQGLQSGNTEDNLLDFSNWTHYGGTSGYANLTLVGNELYATEGSDLRNFSAGAWQDTGFDLPTGASKLFDVGGQLMTSTEGMVYQLEITGFELHQSSTASTINDLVLVGNELYIADSNNGLLNEAGEQLSPAGPLSDSFSNFRVIADELYGFHAPSPVSYFGAEQVTNFSKFSEGAWHEVAIPNFTNVSDVASFNGSLYYASIGDGVYDESNETILTDIPGSSVELDTVITSIASGEALWVSSYNNDNPIHLLDEDMNWTSYASSFLGEDRYLTIDLSQTGIGWLGALFGNITVLDPVENQQDQISTSDGLPSLFIDIEISIEDNAWVATSRGPVLFADASFIFSDSEAIRPTFENRILFENEQINAVMTDGGNRIWFGTNNGLWVYDENTSEQVAVFNEANSPLPSDQVIQLAYNRVNGEVFVLTGKGMISYRSASSIGKP